MFMKRKLLYVITVLLVSALLAYLALVINCYFLITDCPGPMYPTGIQLTATYIEMSNATTKAYIRQTQAGFTPTPVP